MNRYMLAFLNTTEELLGSDQVRMMGRWKHHGPITTLDHSLFVAYLSYRAALALGLDAEAAARGGPASRPVSLRFKRQVRPSRLAVL